jgi:hypothetical protein
VDEAIINWVSDIGSLRGHKTKYWKMVELYWHLKVLLGQMLQNKEDTHNTIQLQLDEFHLMLQEVLDQLHPSSSAMTTMSKNSL